MDLQAERGGADALNVTQREAIRTYAGLALARDLMQAAMARRETVDLEMLGQIGDRMDRQARRMGPVKAIHAPGIREHIAARRAGGANT